MPNHSAGELAFMPGTVELLLTAWQHGASCRQGSAHPKAFMPGTLLLVLVDQASQATQT